MCGAPNVAAGQKVIVATIGTVLYDGDESFTIKKGKLRGEDSCGMICAEDEIGVGTDHDGIIVLPADTPVGISARDYYHVEDDTVIIRREDVCHNCAEGKEEAFEDFFDRLPVELQQQLVTKLAKRLLKNQRGAAYGRH